MGVSLKEAIESAGFDLNTVEDCEWLLSQRDEFVELCEEAEKTIEDNEQERGIVW